jgi:hypothetical protein
MNDAPIKHGKIMADGEPMADHQWSQRGRQLRNIVVARARPKHRARVTALRRMSGSPESCKIRIRHIMELKCRPEYMSYQA